MTVCTKYLFLANLNCDIWSYVFLLHVPPSNLLSSSTLPCPHPHCCLAYFYLSLLCPLNRNYRRSGWNFLAFPAQRVTSVRRPSTRGRVWGNTAWSTPGSGPTGKAVTQLTLKRQSYDFFVFFIKQRILVLVDTCRKDRILYNIYSWSYSYSVNTSPVYASGNQFKFLRLKNVFINE